MKKVQVPVVAQGRFRCAFVCIGFSLFFSSSFLASGVLTRVLGGLYAAFCGVIFGWDMHDRVYTHSQFSTAETGGDIFPPASPALLPLTLPPPPPPPPPCIQALRTSLPASTRVEAQAHHHRRAHRHRGAETGRALEEGAEAETDQQNLQPAVGGDPAQRMLEDSNRPFSFVSDKGTDVQDDPADLPESIDRAQARRFGAISAGMVKT